MERFLEKVDRSGDCWEWLGGKNHRGYGKFWLDGKEIGAHRASVILHGRSVPRGKFVCHACDNPGCVKPDHLWVGTHEENQQDKREKGRSLFGQRNAQSKLTEDQVRYIRSSGERQVDLARRFGVSQSLISAVQCRTAWRHVV